MNATHPSPPDGSRVAPLPARSVEQARERAFAVLTDRYADGLLDDAALERHLDRLHGARDVAAVDALVTAIERATPPQVPSMPHVSPSTSVAAASASGPAYVDMRPPAAHRRILAIMSETRRSGSWVVPSELRVIAVMADVKIDFRKAILPPVVELHATSFMANLHIIVPPGLPVVFEADGFMGTATSAAIEPDAGSYNTVIRVIGGAVMGELRVSVKEAKAR